MSFSGASKKVFADIKQTVQIQMTASWQVAVLMKLLIVSRMSKVDYRNELNLISYCPRMCSNTAFSSFIFLQTVKDQARWIIQFIREMEKVYRATGDKNFNVIIIDYNSSDIDIEARLKKAKLPR